ncbi:hypothetical protein KIH27_01810 [Mycobacterium sp. M1]|uniref:Uncharacterized protein n=1 Tax=Mycolicibacter acidiphilus TaxID=2835306 RepID=A0ABS5RDH3_9MYCO|nr:hypothetical protein [Mycolicibacter acidiphilus]MBS9532320.1 hypothetical protein [Mycolicibacter acidiphilus]
MWNRKLIAGSGAYRRAVDFYLYEASYDWEMLGGVLASAAGILEETVFAGIDPGQVPLADVLVAGEILLGELFDHGVLIGELTDGDPGLEVWAGTRADWFARIRDWVDAHGEIPLPGEFGWLSDPTQQSWRAVSDYHEAPDRMDPRRITAHDAFHRAVELLCADPAGVIPVGTVFVVAHATLREAVYRAAPQRVPFPLDEVSTVADLLFTQLFDRGLTPGDLTDTGFMPWAGTSADWRQRVRDWCDQHGRLPELRDCGWLVPATVPAETAVSAADCFDRVLTTRWSYRDYVDWDLRDAGEHPVDICFPFQSATSVVQRLLVPGNTRPSVDDDIVHAADLILNELFDHGVVAGEPIDEENSSFRPWPGTRDDWLAYIRHWLAEQDRRPREGELAALYRLSAADGPSVQTPTGAITAGAQYRAEVDFYLFDASDDFVMLGDLFASAYHLIRAVRPAGTAESPVPLDQEMAVGEAILNELFDHGVQAGELTGTGDEWFVAWPGGRIAWIARIRDWVREHGDTPGIGDLGWLHDPTMQSWRGKSDYHESPDRMAPERITVHAAFSECTDRLRAQAGRDGVVSLGLVFLSAHAVLRMAIHPQVPGRTRHFPRRTSSRLWV